MTVVHLLLLLLLFFLSISDSSISLSENEALLQLKSSFTNADRLSNWVSDSDPCEERWVGAKCFAGRIQGLHLSDLGLSGKIDINSLLELKGLRTLSFVNNAFAGPIPEFNKLGALRSLLLTKNNFSGEIPAHYFAPMVSLKKFWIPDNKFSGDIPESMMQLPNLIELHLERNQFSGRIPRLKQPKQITSISLANNYLEGEIPSEYSSFSPSALEGNPKLCGKPLNKTCPLEEPSKSQVVVQAPNRINISTMAGIMVITLVAVFIVLTIYSGNGKSEDEKFSMREKENLQVQVLPVQAQSQSSENKSASASASESTSTRSGGSRGGGGSLNGGSSRKGSSHGKIRDLIMVNYEKGSFGLQDLMKASAEVLGSSGMGSAYKAQMTNGVSVVVKRIREMNMMGRDLFDAEMRRFGRIRHKNILTPLAYHFRKEEKLLVSEYIPKGSLSLVLHGEHGISHAELNWVTRLKIVKGIAEGLSFLYTEYSTYNLPHGNLKSSNVLLSQNYEPLLGDYALDPLINTSHLAQALFAYKTPEYTQKHEVTPKSDVYCLGIIILEIMTGKFPSQYITHGRGGTDVVQWAVQAIAHGREGEIIDPEILGKCNSETIQKMAKMLRIGAACTEFDTSKRLDIKEAIRRIEEIN